MPDAPRLTPEQLRLADAYQAKLGDGSADAKLIMDDLRHQTLDDVQDVFALYAPGPGLPVDPLRVMTYEGARALVRRMERMIRWSLTAARGPETTQQFATTEEPPDAA